MNIVILHCHFERGGVTQVVENHVRFLDQCDDVQSISLLSGGRNAGLSDATIDGVATIDIAGFDYDSLQQAEGSLSDRADRLTSQIHDELVARGLHPDQTVLHWHNHSLGKNVAAPVVIKSLANRGYRQVLQVHDFAEDNRPQNYLGLIGAHSAEDPTSLEQLLYPNGDTIAYAALTQADADVLASVAGSATCLFNSVTLPSDDFPDQTESLAKVRRAFDLPDEAVWSLYPVRGIRRKNVGEWLLLTALMPDHHFSGITLAPTTAVEKESYQRWRQVADEFVPGAVFDAGHHEDIGFADNLSAAEKIISTSVAEGFGMTFLEPWLAGREVIARRLPSITRDFEDAGVDLGHFYDSIQIPGTVQWLRQQLEHVDAVFGENQSPFPPPFRLQIDRPSTNTDSIDFALLSTSVQTEVIKRVQGDQGFRQDVVQRNQSLIQQFSAPADQGRLKANAKIIGQHYSIESVGERLLSLYRRMLGEQPISALNPSPQHSSNDAGHTVLGMVNENRPFFPCRIEH